MIVTDGDAVPALNPGMRIEDARGRLIGKLRSVNRDSQGNIESIGVGMGDRVHMLPADNFTLSGDVLVSAMGKGEVRKSAVGQ
ncbi:hypothetical protein ACPVPU_04515 [Sphingomonas sp. CJ99]